MSKFTSVVRWGVAVAALSGAFSAHAFFSDDEARKAILDLRQRVEHARDVWIS